MNKYEQWVSEQPVIEVKKQTFDEALREYYTPERIRESLGPSARAYTPTELAGLAEYNPLGVYSHDMEDRIERVRESLDDMLIQAARAGLVVREGRIIQDEIIYQDDPTAPDNTRFEALNSRAQHRITQRIRQSVSAFREFLNYGQGTRRRS